MAADQASKIIQNQLEQVAKVVEQHVDAEIERLDNLGEDDLESIRRQRIAQMKKMQDMKATWKQLGHGEYSELAEEKDFFEVGKQSKNAVCHFYRDSAERCKIVDKHLRILAAKHLECRFVKINAEKSPFLAERLKIRVIPTLCLIKDSKTKDYIVGFDDLGGRDDFSTEMMEWRIAQAQVINYNGDLLTPPDQPKKMTKIIGVSKKGKTIRGGDDDDSSDDDY